MKLNREILDEIKRRVHEQEPGAKIILYGSYARGDATEESDIDLLILLNRFPVTYDEIRTISDPLYHLGVETDQLISPLVRSKKDWEEKYFFTPLYYNIKAEGIEL
jgi:predicted nucleotidyltransferase